MLEVKTNKQLSIRITIKNYIQYSFTIEDIDKDENYTKKFVYANGKKISDFEHFCGANINDIKNSYLFQMLKNNEKTLSDNEIEEICKETEKEIILGILRHS